MTKSDKVRRLKTAKEKAARIEKQRRVAVNATSILDIVKTYDLTIRPNFGPFNNNITQVLENHNNGIFTLSGLFADTLITDERVNNALTKRISWLMDLWNTDYIRLVPRSEESQSVLSWFDRNLFDIVDPTAINYICIDRFMLGFSIQQINYGPDFAESGPRLSRWHPVLTQYMQMNRSFALITMNNGIEYINNNAKWQIFSNSNEENNYYRCWTNCGLLNLTDVYLKKRFALRDWSRYSELYGNPPKLVQIPSDASEPEKEQYLQQLKTLTTEASIPVMCDEDGKPLWTISFLAPEADSPAIMKDLVEYCNQTIDIAILGTDGIVQNPAPYGATASLLQSVAGANPRLEMQFILKDVNIMLQNIAEVIFGSAKFAPKVQCLYPTNEVTTSNGKSPSTRGVDVYDSHAGSKSKPE